MRLLIDNQLINQCKKKYNTFISTFCKIYRKKCKIHKKKYKFTEKVFILQEKGKYFCSPNSIPYSLNDFS